MLELLKKLKPLIDSTTLIDAKSVDALALTKDEKSKLRRCRQHMANYLKLEETMAVIAARRKELASLLSVDEGRIEVKEDGSFEVKAADNG